MHGRKSIKLLTCHYHLHHMSIMQLGHLLTHSGLTYPEVSSKVCHDRKFLSATRVGDKAAVAMSQGQLSS